MIDKVTMLMAYAGIVLVGLLMMPYLLYLAWERIITLKRQSRGLDFDLRMPK